MQNRDRVQTQKVFRAEKRLKALSKQKRLLTIKLISQKKSIEELNVMEASVVYHKIDSILIPRDRLKVIEDINETINSLKSQINEIDEKIEKEMNIFKKLASNKKPWF